uniref:TNFR-Cys domain-containing protein n=1 Tax=Bicosoecida sp. CB-2014 TaxID=1486930 RepID=A0A7S1C2Y5_9STRA
MCSTCVSGEFASTDCGAFDNPAQDRECSVCAAPCDTSHGQFEEFACGGVQDRVCSACGGGCDKCTSATTCTACVAGTYWDASAAACVPCTVCDAGRYDRTCATGRNAVCTTHNASLIFVGVVVAIFVFVALVVGFMIRRRRYSRHQKQDVTFSEVAATSELSATSRV